MSYPNQTRISADFDENDLESVPGGLLGELDAEQDDVLRRLDDLNLKIEELMREWSSLHQDEPDANIPDSVISSATLSYLANDTNFPRAPS